LLTLAPVVRKQKAATLAAESVDEPSALGLRTFQQMLVAEPEQIGMKLAGAPEGQRRCDLARVVPAGVAQGFEHQKLERTALSPGSHRNHCKHCECSAQMCEQEHAKGRNGTSLRSRQWLHGWNFRRIVPDTFVYGVCKQ